MLIFVASSVVSGTHVLNSLIGAESKLTFHKKCAFHIACYIISTMDEQNVS